MTADEATAQRWMTSVDVSVPPGMSTREVSLPLAREESRVACGLVCPLIVRDSGFLTPTFQERGRSWVWGRHPAGIGGLELELDRYQGWTEGSFGWK